ncbi:hypothetical protein K443DRAFT_90664 [Laccaria amethystina LaAM-08-1]|uniref:Uncharacterized protein n=1 Tax=Laccaria amethystina LaAM-08-1 TaxID=1095629 RepID=A0A0C9XVX6_9AGAR|nr:hypothetical protein K443DRAFT_90664 [Laccaria amethystina LaAM-08-1]
MGVRGPFQPRSAHDLNPASEPPSSNGFSSRVNDVSSLGRSATVAWTSLPDPSLLPVMEMKSDGHLCQRSVERAVEIHRRRVLVKMS